MTSLSPSLRENPDLDSWVRIDEGGTITLFTGKVEVGQGLLTALARLGAEELDVALDRIRIATFDSATSPDELGTISSLSMLESGTAIRQATAEARAHLLGLAAAELGEPAEGLVVDDGRIVSPGGASTDYWRLLAGGRFGIKVTGAANPKPPAERRILGTSTPRIDLPGIVTGTTRYVQDLVVEGTLRGRVVRPPSFAASLDSVDLDRVRAGLAVRADPAREVAHARAARLRASSPREPREVKVGG